MTEQEILEVGGSTYVNKGNNEERRRRIAELVSVIETAQRARVITGFPLLTDEQVVATYGISRRWLHANVSHDVVAYYVEVSKAEKEKKHQDDVAYSRLYEEQTARQGKGELLLSLEGAIAFLGITEKRARRIFARLPDSLRNELPASLKRVDPSKPLPKSVQAAAEAVNRALAERKGETAPEPSHRTRADIERAMFIELLWKAVAEGRLRCPEHPDAVPMWSCGDRIAVKEEKVV